MNVPNEQSSNARLPPAWKPTRAESVKTGRWAYLAGAAAIVIAALLWIAVAARIVPPAELYETAVTGRQSLENTIAATGKIRPRDYVDVGAQVSGQLQRLHVSIGDDVAAGQQLADIDAEVQAATVEGIEADLARLRAELAEQEAGLAYAQRELDRNRHLERTSAVSRSALEAAERERDVLQARIDASTARIRQSEASLRAEKATMRRSRIVAPMSGTVVAIDAKVGQTLNANYDTPIILTIADLATMTVWGEVSEADVVKLQEGMPVWFTTLGDPNRKWHASLRQVLPVPPRRQKVATREPAAPDPSAVVRYTALFEIENTDRSLKSEMTAQVSFVLNSRENALVIPIAALIETVSSSTAPRNTEIRVLNEDGSVSTRTVATGIRTRFAVEVLRGLEEGEKVIIGTRSRDGPSLLRVEP